MRPQGAEETNSEAANLPAIHKMGRKALCLYDPEVGMASGSIETHTQEDDPRKKDALLMEGLQCILEAQGSHRTHATSSQPVLSLQGPKRLLQEPSCVPSLDT